jgi:hypothetical protein
MSHSSRAAFLAVLPILWAGSILCAGVSASAETLRCQSINGNVNCAGSGGVSCQTVDGRKVCVSNGGGVVQSFGNHAPSDNLDNSIGADDEGLNNTAPDPDMPVPARQDRHGHGGHTLLIDRAGRTLHLQTDTLSIDRD